MKNKLTPPRGISKEEFDENVGEERYALIGFASKNDVVSVFGVKDEKDFMTVGFGNLFNRFMLFDLDNMWEEIKVERNGSPSFRYWVEKNDNKTNK